MVIAAESSGTGNAAELQVVSYTSLISRALENLGTISGHASAEKASRSSAVMLAGVGNRSISARNQSDRLLPAKRAISGK
jgi:hypothetical protein